MARLSSLAPLVGRAGELSRLDAALRDAAAGRPSAVLVAGDAGVGKTRLLAEFSARARAGGATVLLGHCVDLGTVGLPYLPFTEVLQQVADLARDGRPEWTEAWLACPALSRLVSGPRPAGDRSAPVVDDGTGALQLFDAVRGLLAAVSATAPVVLVVEDLHWAEQSTRAMLSFLLTRLRAERLVVVASYRSDDLHRRHPLRQLLAEMVRLPTVERVDLEPFTEPQMREYLRALDGGGLAEPVARSIVARSEGNPYYAEELLAATSLGTASLPTGLADVLLTRLERLAPDVQQIARVASVAGRRVTHRLLQAAAGLSDPDMEAALREAVTHHVLVPECEERYAFRHALLQEAVYGDLLPGERVRLHGRYAALLAEALDSPRPLGSAAELAHHRVQSHDLPGALVASVRAADEAACLPAPAESFRHLERALDLWAAVPGAAELVGTDAIRLGLRAAAAAGNAGEPHRAIRLARAVRDRLEPGEDPELALLVRQRLAHHLMAADDTESASREVGEALDAAPAGPPSEAWAAAAATKARAALFLERLEEAHDTAARALEAARAVGAVGVQIEALTTLAILEGIGGRPDLAFERLAEARDRVDPYRQPDVWARTTYNLASNRFYEGDMAAALAVLDDGVERARLAGLTWNEFAISMRNLQVIARYVAGDWDGSERASELAGDVPPDAVAAQVAAACLYVDVGRGRPGTRACIERLRGAPSADWMTALTTGALLADLLRWEGDLDGSRQAADETMEWVGKGWESWSLAGIWLAALALATEADRVALARLRHDDAAVARGVEDGRRLVDYARETAARGRPRAGSLGPEGRGWLARVEAEWARLTRDPDPGPWRAALAEFESWYPYEEARCRWRLAEALLGADRRDEAAEQARAALRIADSLGARPLAGAVGELARRGRLDVGLPARASAGPAAAGLTARERDVLAQLARGRTNRQIGAALYISEKTVSVHVSNLMGKLGASGRTEAVAIAARRGLLTNDAPT